MATSPFRIGLCLAGAVSAGAYTAGVLDFLVEALQAWQKRKDDQVPNTPQHDVQISVIGGASAGGMTGIIFGSAINQPYSPLNKFPVDINTPQPNHKLYHSWVDLVQDDMFPLLLKTDDINTKQIYSLLNSSFIDQIAARVTLPAAFPKVNPSFIDANLKLFTTLTNLEGFEYNVAFKNTTTNNKYWMSIHNDYACFKLNSNNYAADGWTPLDFFTNTNVSIARDAAMATGAFPVGLKARKLVRDARHVKDNPWLKGYLNKSPFALVAGETESINVDGGVINNEPFEKVQDVLLQTTGDKIDATYDTFKGTVVMVDPFPSVEEKFDNNLGLATVVGNTLSAMLAQNRAKPLVLENAWDSKNPLQFLISPTRPHPTSTGNPLVGSRAIACGALGGFSGFMHKHFRIHDFYLGRANCEHFLRHYFTVPANTSNPIFVQGYQSVIDRAPYQSSVDGGLQIIPLFTAQRPAIPLPQFPNGSNWPSIDDKTIHSWQGAVRKRIQALLLNFDDYRWDTRLLLWIGAQVVINRKGADVVIKAIKDALRKHQLLN